MNPRYIPVTKDDTMWFFDTTPTDTYPLNHPATWYKNTIYRDSDPSCPMPKRRFQILQTDVRTSQAQLAGVCGTSLIIASGYSQTVLNSFYAWRISKLKSRMISSEEWSDFLKESASRHISIPGIEHELMLVRSATTQYWDDFEKNLSDLKDRYGYIDFYFFRAEKLVYIHLELGRDQGFVSKFYSELSSVGEFLNWLKTGKTIARNLWEVLPDGNIVPISGVPVDKLVFRDEKTPNFEKDLIGAEPPCPPTCVYRACSLMVGELTTFDPSNGNIEIDLSLVAIKSYCDDGNGGPCPPL